MLSQNISTWNYIPFTVSDQNTLLKPENPTQGYMTNHHKDVKYATKISRYAMKTSSYAMKCHKDISCATKTSVMPQRPGANIPMSQRLEHLVGYSHVTAQRLKHEELTVDMKSKHGSISSSSTKTLQIPNIFTRFSNFPKSFLVDKIFYQFSKYHKSR